MKDRVVLVLLVVLVVAVVSLASSSTYSAWVSSQHHNQSCTRAKLLVSAFEDVIVIALTPAKGKTFTEKQAASVTAFEAAADARLNEALC